MNFHIDLDNGKCIGGWLIPDNPGEVPEFVFKIPGRADIVMPANVLRPDIRDLGLHSSGLVGFHFDEFNVPDLPEFEELRILEAESRIPIYRRARQENFLETKLILAEVGGFPQLGIYNKVMKSFMMGYPIVERFSQETIFALLSNAHAKSSVLFGQLNWSRFGQMVKEQGYRIGALVRDPFDELAERLIFLSLMSRHKNVSLANAALVRLAPLMPLIETVDLTQSKSLLSGFRKLTAEQRRLIRSPMTWTFGCNPEEEPQRRNVSVAIDNLAMFDVVGTRERFSYYAELVEAKLGAAIFQDATPDVSPNAQILSRHLAQIGIVADLLDEDIALYGFVQQAIETSIANNTSNGDARAQDGSRP